MKTALAVVVLMVFFHQQFQVTSEQYGEAIDSMIYDWSNLLMDIEQENYVLPQFQDLRERIKMLVEEGLILPLKVPETYLSHNMYLMSYCIPRSEYADTIIRSYPSIKQALEDGETMNGGREGIDKAADTFISRMHKKPGWREQNYYHQSSEEDRATYYDSYINRNGDPDYFTPCFHALDAIKYAQKTKIMAPAEEKVHKHHFHMPHIFRRRFWM